MDNPKFSVAMSVYKNDIPEYFERALESVTTLQTLKPSEIVLIVDGPVPDSINKVIQKYENETGLLKTIRLNENKGLGNALHLAVNEATFNIIARMDSDDISMPNRFQTEMQILENEEIVDIVGSNISEFIDEEQNIVAYRIVPNTDEEIKKYLMKRCPFNHMTVMFRKEAVLKSGNYQDLFWNEDYYLWIRMAENGCYMRNIQKPLVNVRTGKDMYSRRGGYRYFQSELWLQKYMHKKHIITFPTFAMNIVKRFILQIMMPSNIRGYIFRKFARQNG